MSANQRNNRYNLIAARAEWRVNKNVKILKKTPLLNDIGIRTIATFIYQIKILTLKRNKQIFKEGEAADYIYVIKKGEVLLQKEMEIKIDEDIFRPINEILKPKRTMKKKVEVLTRLLRLL